LELKLCIKENRIDERMRAIYLLNEIIKFLNITSEKSFNNCNDKNIRIEMNISLGSKINL
jgi:predicted nucleic acid-binding protein